MCNSSFVQVVSISFFCCTYKVLLEPSRCPSVWMSVCLSHLNYSKTARPIDIKVWSVDLFTYLLVSSLRRSSHICERSVQFSFFLQNVAMWCTKWNGSISSFRNWSHIWSRVKQGSEGSKYNPLKVYQVSFLERIQRKILKKITVVYLNEI